MSGVECPRLSDTHVVETQCPNCTTPLKGQFCSYCGQNQNGFDRFFLTLIRDAFDDIFATDSRAAKTILALLFRPGFLTQEYFAGHRARYVQPIRLYFITSLSFFFLLSVLTAINPTQEIISIDTDETSQQGISLDSPETEIFEVIPEEHRALLKQKFDKLETRLENEPREILDELVEMAPPVIFCLLPIFAILLKLAYLNTDRFYTEHLVLAVHNHCFVYLALLFGSLLSLTRNHLTDSISSAIDIAIPVYMFFSLKTTYREGWFLTLVKFIFLGVSYCIFLLLGIVIAAIIGFLQL